MSLAVFNNQIFKLPVSLTTIPVRAKSILSITHPEYDLMINNWDKWALIYEGGDQFVETFVKKFSKRENPYDFRLRKSITPIPSFAKASINEIKNSIFERMNDVVRSGGPVSYQIACSGSNGGVDLRGGNMNWFIGHHILPQLLTMKKVGVFVDSPDRGRTLSDSSNKHPYLYCYRAKDIRSWSYQVRDDKEELQAILLRDWNEKKDDLTGLPVDWVESYRRLWLNQDGFVEVEFYDQNGVSTGRKTLTIKKIPFVIFELTDSLLKDVANHQIALVNLESSDISYALRGNTVLYIEQANPLANSPAIKAAQQEFKRYEAQGTAIPTEQCLPKTDLESEQDVQTGGTEGRTFAGTIPPAFINPSAEPLKASMDKQQKLKEDTRQLVHLSLSAVQSKMASAESKGMDRKGLESGLSNIGLELEHGERKIGVIWSLYEAAKDSPTVSYPEEYSLKTIEDIVKEIGNLREVRDDLPSPTAKRELNKEIARRYFSVRVPPEVLRTIQDELDTAKVPSSDPKVTIADVEAGLLSAETASIGRGYEAGEATKSQEESAKRQAQIASAQSQAFGARGVKDLAPPGDTSGSLEKINQPTRGEAAL